MPKSKPTKKPVQQKPAEGELSETALAQAAGGSFSWGMQDIHFCDGSVRPATNPGELLPAVQKTTN
ncbi:MAG TPA: hypothetical protein VHE77_22390 [Dongiaceae bacterium]|jgi:hypothetical protein|nr:hypothetical protein [Dongiaceae bacterium]